MYLKITTRTTATTAILAVTLVVAAAATFFMSTPQQIAQAITLEEAIQLLNQGADEVES
jgi:hypothetical protein